MFCCHFSFSYPIFPSRLDPALFPQTTPTSAGGNGMRPHLSQHCITNVQSGSPMVSRRTAAEKKKDNQVLHVAVAVLYSVSIFCQDKFSLILPVIFISEN